MFRIGVGSFAATDLMRQYINQVLDSGRVTYGPFSKTLETVFATKHDCKYGVLSNSGTSSLLVALQALKELGEWPDGSEVIVPATTFVATVNVVLQSNMVPVPIDIDALTYNMDPSLIERAITEKTRAIIPVHLFGQPAWMTDIIDIAGRHNLRIIEDSCETILARHRGAVVGSMGDVGCFSFYAAHHVAAGVGGMATTNDPELAAIMRSLVNHGRDGVYISPDDALEGHELSRRFRFERVGHSFRITEFESAIALAQMETIELQVQRRRAITSAYKAGLKEFPLTLPHTRNMNTHSWMMYPILSKRKDELVPFLEEHGIETRDMLPLINQPVYQDMGWNMDRFPIAEKVDELGFYIGCHPDITDDDVKYVIETMRWFHER